MDSEYQFELVLVRFVLKRPILAQSLLRVSLVEPNRELDSTAPTYETLEYPIKRTQKVVELDSLPLFVFSSNSSGNFLIKYEVKANRGLPVNSVNVNVAVIVKEFERNSKGIFEEKYEGESSELFYKVLVSRKERELNLDIAQQQKQENEVNQEEAEKEEAAEKEENQIRQSNSRNNSPPTIKLDNQNLDKHQQEAPSPTQLQAYLRDHPNPQLKPHSSHEQSISISNLQRKIESLPLSQIQKVNELIATHHRSDDSQVSTEGISYKIKIVVIMVIVGLVFLLNDTLSDRKVKKEARSHFEQQHEVAREGVKRRKEERLARKKEGNRKGKAV